MTDVSPNNPLADPIPTAPPTSQWQDVWRQFKQHKGAVLGGGFLPVSYTHLTLPTILLV